MTDVVYILGSGSKWDNNEIRYSLRSVEKHLKGIGSLFIVGFDPGFLKGHIHIRMADIHGENANRNILEKTLAACKDERVSNTFYASSDDIFLLKDFQASTFPRYHRNDLMSTIKKMKTTSGYRITLSNTHTVLSQKKLPTINFNIHAPFLYDKKKFPDVVSQYPMDVHYGYGVKSLYANTLKLDGEYLPDCKIDEVLTYQQIFEKIKKRPLFSIGDKGINKDMKSILYDLYPNPSRWERQRS